MSAGVCTLQGNQVKIKLPSLRIARPRIVVKHLEDTIFVQFPVLVSRYEDFCIGNVITHLAFCVWHFSSAQIQKTALKCCLPPSLPIRKSTFCTKNQSGESQVLFTGDYQATYLVQNVQKIKQIEQIVQHLSKSKQKWSMKF